MGIGLLQTDPSANSSRPVPAEGRPKPSMTKPHPKATVRALYDYQAQDTDEISLVEGEIVELIREGMSQVSG